MNLSQQRKVTVAFTLALLLIAAVGIVQYGSVRRLNADSQWVSHSQEVLLQLRTLQNNLNRTDAAAQSFVITGDRSYLPTFNLGINNIRMRLQSLRELTVDNAAQRGRIAELEPRLNNGIHSLQQEIDAKSNDDVPDETALVQASVRRSLDEIRGTLAEMVTAEIKLLDERNQAAQRANLQAGLAVLFGSLAAILLLAASAIALRMDIAKRGQTEAKFRQLLESAPDSIIIANREGRIVLTNNRTEALFGYDRSEFLGRSLDMLLPEYHRARVAGYREGFFEPANGHDARSKLELSGLTKDGASFPVEISMSPIETGGEMMVSSVIRDITGRKEAEANLRTISGRLLQMQEDERRHIGRELHDSLGQYLSVLKMGLYSLQTNAKLAGDGAVPKLAECIDLADKSLTEVRTASYLLYPPMLDELGLKTATHAYLDGFAKHSGVETTFEIPPDFGRLSRDVELALFRVLQESLTNLHRHSGSATAHVRVITEDGFIRLEVEDDGRGMPPERLDEFQKGSPGKLGVGLRGMHERMLQFGGKLEVFSNGRGTTIIATVSRAAAIPSAEFDLFVPPLPGATAKQGL